MKQISLRPYHGNLYLAESTEDYEQSHKLLFETPDVLDYSQAGRFSAGEGKDGFWTYLVLAESPARLAHEFSHVVFHVFERCGIDARHDDGEAFCYMLDALMTDAQSPPKIATGIEPTRLELSDCTDVKKLQFLVGRLWCLLDDIDTLPDMLHPANEAGYKKFYELAIKRCEERGKYLWSDGHLLFVTEQPVSEPPT